MKKTIQQLLAEIVKVMGVDDAEISVEIPENYIHGDYTTNIAMLLAGRLKAPPMKIGQEIIDQIKAYQNDSMLSWLEHVQLVAPGFINLTVSSRIFSTNIDQVLTEKNLYGSMQKAQSSNDKHSQKYKDIDEKMVANSPLGQSKKITQSSTSKRAKKQTTVHHDAEKDPTVEHLASYGKKIMVEFAHPNTHKAFHIGHLRNITTGEAVIRMLESQGNEVIRVNYQGDVGMHIAKALYSLLEVSPFKGEVDTVKGVKERVEFLGKAYAAGSTAFEEDEKAKGIIKDLNALIYASAQRYAKEVGRDPGTTDYLALVQNHVHPLDRVYELWKETRQWSLDYFEIIYARVDSRYDRLYFESECLAGVDVAKDAVKQGVLKESDGAIIFDGKPFGVDTRVFVNSLGLPTYEGKELALSRMETSEFGSLDQIIHVVGPEQASFFSVTFKAEELLGFVRPGMQRHLVYGWVKLKHGKMSSRTGNVILGEWLLDEAKKSIYEILDKTHAVSSRPTSRDPSATERIPGQARNDIKSETEKETIAEACAIAAVKYSFLKVGTNQEIAFDLKESVSFEGDSGTYLLYTYARCRSVLRKASVIPASEPESSQKNKWIPDHARDDKLNLEERTVARKISQFPEVVSDATSRFAPNVICTYLFQLAQEFNAFYGKHSILDSANATKRLALTAAVAQVLKNGLNLLGIPVVERM